VAYYDMPAVRAIVSNARKTNYTFSSIVLGIAESMPFQMRMPATDTERLPLESTSASTH
jgi:hypothetical protein